MPISPAGTQPGFRVRGPSAKNLQFFRAGGPGAVSAGPFRPTQETAAPAPAEKLPIAPSQSGAAIAPVPYPTGVGGGLPAPESPALAGLQSLQQQPAGPEQDVEGQMLSGPSLGRHGIGQRIPPSLAALLRPKVY